MPRHYVNITKDEFEEVLDKTVEYQEIDMAGVNERVYSIDLPSDPHDIRVFSTIVGENSRGCGRDSIKIVIWNDTLEEPVGGRRKTLRIGPTDSNPHGWKANIVPKIADLLANWRNELYGDCPECSGTMCYRNGKYGEFLGCSNYPECKHTDDL